MASGLTRSDRVRWDVARLVAPYNLGAFLSEHWETKPLHVRHGDPAYFADLLTLSDVDELVATASVAAGQVKVVGGPSGKGDDGDADRGAARMAMRPRRAARSCSMSAS